jgi:hypothetical protein
VPKRKEERLRGWEGNHLSPNYLATIKARKSHLATPLSPSFKDFSNQGLNLRPATVAGKSGTSKVTRRAKPALMRFGMEPLRVLSKEPRVENSSQRKQERE